MVAAAITERKLEIRGFSPKAFVVQRFQQVAEGLSMKGYMATRVELANEALSRFAQVLYETDTDGVWANVDSVTHRVLVPTPWGRKGRKRWEFRRTDADILRGVLLARQDAETKPARPHLYIFDWDCRCWLFNLEDYPRFAAAEKWLKYSQVTLEEWRRVNQDLFHRVSQRVSS